MTITAHPHPEAFHEGYEFGVTEERERMRKALARALRYLAEGNNYLLTRLPNSAESTSMSVDDWMTKFLPDFFK